MILISLALFTGLFVSNFEPDFSGDYEVVQHELELPNIQMDMFPTNIL